MGVGVNCKEKKRYHKRKEIIELSLADKGRAQHAKKRACTPLKMCSRWLSKYDSMNAEGGKSRRQVEMSEKGCNIVTLSRVLLRTFLAAAVPQIQHKIAEKAQMAVGGKGGGG